MVRANCNPSSNLESSQSRFLDIELGAALDSGTGWQWQSGRFHGLWYGCVRRWYRHWCFSHSYFMEGVGAPVDVLSVQCVSNSRYKGFPYMSYSSHDFFEVHKQIPSFSVQGFFRSQGQKAATIA